VREWRKQVWTKGVAEMRCSHQRLYLILQGSSEITLRKGARPLHQHPPVTGCELSLGKWV